MTTARWIGIFVALVSLRAETLKSTRWNVIDLRQSVNEPLHRIVFVNDRVGWISAGANTLLKTADSGKTWSVLRTNLATNSEIGGLWFLNENRGWAAGSAGQRPVIWITEDGGSTWIIKQNRPSVSVESSGAMLDICFSDEIHGWAVGFNGVRAVIVSTRDRGEHWETQYSGAEITRQFSRIRFTDSLHGWALSFDAVMQTRDGGQLWQLRHYDSGLLNEVEPIGLDEAWVAGAWGRINHTLNGVVWSSISLSESFADRFFGYVRFVGAERGWVSGTKCEILATRNSGKVWAVEECPLPPEVRADITTAEMVKSPGRLYIIANPGLVLVRSID